MARTLRGDKSGRQRRLAGRPRVGDGGRNASVFPRSPSKPCRDAGRHTWRLQRGGPPLPIPNREVKPRSADDTALTCGKVGRRHHYNRDGQTPSLFFFAHPYFLPDLSHIFKLNLLFLHRENFEYHIINNKCDF